VTSVRQRAPLSADWKRSVEEDMQYRVTALGAIQFGCTEEYLNTVCV